MTNVNYIAIVPPANLVHSIYDFYVEQQTWVSAQLQNNIQYTPSPRTLALSPSPLTLSPPRKIAHRRRRASKPRVNLDLRTRLTYLSRQSPIHSRHLRRQRRRPTHTPSASTTKNVRRRTSTSLSTRTASPPRTPPRETLSPTPVPPTANSSSSSSSAGMALLAMYGDMVKDRMQSCMRLEEMVRDSRSRDLFAVSLF